MPLPASSLRDIRKVCSPRPLRQDELARLYVATDAGRDPHQSIRQAIGSILDDSDHGQRMLVYGLRGSGKSTELAKLVQDLGNGWMTVSFSIQEDLPPLRACRS